eukprot:UN01373
MYLIGYGVENSHKSAVQFFGRAANAADPNARAFLGSMYLRGYGIKQDFNEAHRLLDDASKLGDTRAKRFLAETYEQGIGVTTDSHVALRLSEKASEDSTLAEDVRGEACAISGRCYAQLQNWEKAVHHFQIGSDLHEKDCQANLGHIYDVGVGLIESNVAKAVYLLYVAAQHR